MKDKNSLSTDEFSILKGYVKVSGYKDYYINDRGSVYSAKSHKFLQRPCKSSGYQIVSLCRNGSCRQFVVHRLVYEAFVGPIPEGYVVNHIDGCKTNNFLMNLEAVTRSYNTKHAWEIGLCEKARLKNCNNKKLDEFNVLSIMTLRQSWSNVKISKFYNVNKSTIANIYTGRTYIYITEPCQGIYRTKSYI